MTANPFLLAADDSPALLPLLQEKPELVSKQDEHGYSLLHAAASYNHVALILSLKGLGVDPNLLDEDGETALFVAESVKAAQSLLDIGVDRSIKNADGLTAGEKIRLEGDFTVVADFLEGTTTPSIPNGLDVQLGSMEESDLGEVEDSSLRQRIEELATREDFQTEKGQDELRNLITDALRGIDRDVRRK